MGDDSQGLFSGTEAKIACFLKLGDGESRKQRATYRRVATRVCYPAEFVPFILDLYQVIRSNRKERLPSRENWRWNCQTDIDDDNDSKEVLLERAVALLVRAKHLERWCNQIPVASGLAHSSFDKRAAVDLARLSPDRLDLYELKLESDTPLFAAFEILLYGLAYVYCRSNATKPEFAYGGLPTMQVSTIGLNVLAPRDFYEDLDLRRLQAGMEMGFQAVVSQELGGGIGGDFRFMTLPAGFRPPFADGEEVNMYCRPGVMDRRARIVCEALSKLQPLHPS